MDYAKHTRRTIGLLSSMVSSGENHSDESQRSVRVGLDALDKLTEQLKQRDATNKEQAEKLPEGMKDCTIIFKECPVGHGTLTAKNWVQHGCLVCENKEKADRIAELERGLRWLINSCERYSSDTYQEEEPDLRESKALLTPKTDKGTPVAFGGTHLCKHDRVEKHCTICTDKGA